MSRRLVALIEWLIFNEIRTGRFIIMDDEDEEISDKFLSFLHDSGRQAKEVCRELKKILNKKKRKKKSQ